MDISTNTINTSLRLWQMFLWLVGLVSSISLVFLTLDINWFFVTLPLWWLGGFFVYRYLNRVDSSNLSNPDLFCVATFWVALFVSLDLSSGSVNRSSYLICIMIGFVGVFIVYMVRDISIHNTRSCDNTPCGKCANWVSKLSFFTAFIFFYGAETKSIDMWVPLIPSVTFVLGEIMVIYILSKQDLTATFIRDRFRARVTSLVAIIVFIILISIHLGNHMDSTTLYILGVVIYAIGLVIIQHKYIMKVKETFLSNGSSNRKNLTMVDNDLVGP